MYYTTTNSSKGQVLTVKAWSITQLCSQAAIHALKGFIVLGAACIAVMEWQQG
jgi:hypothetical protein